MAEPERAALSQHLQDVRALLVDFRPQVAKDAVHAAGDAVRAAGASGELGAQEARVLLGELERAWTTADALERAWGLLDQGRFREAGALAASVDGVAILDDERGQLAAHLTGLRALSAALDSAGVALAWSDFPRVDAAAQAAAMQAWSLHLDGLLAQPQLESVERWCDDMRGRADAPANAIHPGARGVATLAIQYTDMAGEFTPELYAFTRALTYIEGTDHLEGYWTEVGNRRHEESTQVHPGALNVHRFKWTGYISDAYGRYQMLSTTWSTWAQVAGVPVALPGTNEKGARYYDMRPEYQDLAVLRFLQREGVEALLVEGDLRGAVNTRAARQWSSIPGGSQPNQRTWKFYGVYKELLAEEREAATGAGDRGPLSGV